MDDQKSLKLFVHIRPLHLLTTVVLYFLGVGFSRYLGQRIDLGALLTGLGWLIAISQGLNIVGDYFKAPFDRGLINREIDKNNPRSQAMLAIAAALLAAAALITVIQDASRGIPAALALVMAVYFLIYGAFVIPGVGLDQSGIGEFFTSIVLVIFPPALGYMFQVGEFHRFLTLAIFPLFPLHLAMLLILRLRSYPADSRSKRGTLHVRLGWKRGIVVHNWMILSGFLFFGFALLFGMSLRMIGPVFFTLPAAAYLIWTLTNIEKGAPVRWKQIIFFSLVVFFLPVYLMFYTAWFQ